LKDGEFGFVRGPGWHASIIKEGTYLGDLVQVGGRKYSGREGKMPVATGTFRWTEVFRVNIAVLDQQHQQLIDTMNQLDQALRKGEGKAALDQVLDKLVEYALVHFATEESLMEQHQFPGLFSHRAQHEEFRKRLAEYLEAHKAGKPGVPVSLLFFMQEWIKEHLSKTDKLYSAFLNARGVR
jgi:hemerythrin